MVLLELFAGIADMLAYYVDAQAAECYLPTARQRHNIANLCALVGYRLHGPIASTTRVQFTLEETLNEDILIPSGTVISAADEIQPIYFTSVRDLSISTGNAIGEVDAVQGVPVTESFIGTGTPCEKVVLNRIDIAHRSVSVKVTNTDWIQVDHFVESGSESMHYCVDIDGLDNVSIIFGDGKYGAYPGEGQQIEVSYLATLGANGNLAPHRINTLLSTIYASNGESVGLSVDNIIAATGGADRESQEHAKAIAPTTVRSTWKTVTRDDYAALCLAFPGVAKAKIMDINDDSSLRIYTVRICIAPEGGGLPSPLLKSELTDYLEARRLLTIDAGIVDPVYIPVNINAELFIYPGEVSETVQNRAQDALEKYFAFENQDFGKELYLSDLIVLLDGVQGVSHIVLREPFTDVLPGSREIPVLGDTTLMISEVR